MTQAIAQQQNQKRAASALKWLQDNKRTQFSSELKPKSAHFPVMIHSAGLGQACAFYKSRENGTAEKALYEKLSRWLTQEMDEPIYANTPTGQSDLLAAITTSSQDKYRLAQIEAQAYLFWIKHLAKAELAGSET